ncbi:MAG: nucleotide exchange factor GrpE [Erysipelothrix sp.]|jgi:molecular chaperone GrpE|nr:nucleotide exchange factor GrpE [Erysipelothrix sp.]
MKENDMPKEKLNSVKEEAEKLEEVVEEISDQQLIEKLSQDNEKLKNEYFKAYADAENFKKRSQREVDNLMKYRIQSFANDVLPVLDNLERALSAPTSDESFKTGVQMIYDQLVAALEKEGVKEIEALGNPFNPQEHHAIAKEKQEDVEAGIVTEVYQKGYILKDRVLRASMVKVSE